MVAPYREDFEMASFPRLVANPTSLGATGTDSGEFSTDTRRLWDILLTHVTMMSVLRIAVSTTSRLCASREIGGVRAEYRQHKYISADLRTR
jgi:hypothetical protein